MSHLFQATTVFACKMLTAVYLTELVERVNDFAETILVLVGPYFPCPLTMPCEEIQTSVQSLMEKEPFFAFKREKNIRKRCRKEWNSLKRTVNPSIIYHFRKSCKRDKSGKFSLEQDYRDLNKAFSTSDFPSAALNYVEMSPSNWLLRDPLKCL